MSCGRLAFGEAMVNEPQPYDVQFLGYQRVALGEALEAWLGAWPRFVEVGGERVLLGAGERFLDWNAMQLAIGTAPRGWGRERLLATGVPEGHAPDGLPKVLRRFAEIWVALRWNDATPVAELKNAETRFQGPNHLAREEMTRRGV